MRGIFHQNDLVTRKRDHTMTSCEAQAASEAKAWWGLCVAILGEIVGVLRSGLAVARQALRSSASWFWLSDATRPSSQE